MVCDFLTPTALHILNDNMVEKIDMIYASSNTFET